MIDLTKLKAEELLQRALDNDLSIEEATKFLSKLNDRTEEEVCDVAHAVVHFITDQDIRQTDHEYDRLQRMLLNEKLDSLRR